MSKTQIFKLVLLVVSVLAAAVQSAAESEECEYKQA